jgi:hypothetical protein
VFNWVPFGSAGRIMGDRDNQVKLIGQVSAIPNLRSLGRSRRNI